MIGKENKTGVIVGATIGVLVLFACIVIAVICYQRRKTIEKTKEYEMRMVGGGE